MNAYRLSLLGCFAGALCAGAPAVSFDFSVQENGCFGGTYHTFDTIALFSKDDNLAFSGDFGTTSYPWQAGHADPVLGGYRTVWLHGDAPVQYLLFHVVGSRDDALCLYAADYVVYSGANAIGNGVFHFDRLGGHDFTPGGAGVHANPVPEPFTMLLAVGALGSVVATRRRR